MMKRQFTMIVACGLLATALACGDKSNPASPSPAGGSGGVGGATADGSTLKVTAPTPTGPANGSTLTESNVSLTINASSGKFGDAGTLAYRFQILQGSQVAKEFRGQTLSWRIPTDLNNKTQYSWRARAEQGSFFGPWSAEWTFTTPDQPEGWVNTSGVYDPLIDGKTVGIVHGAVTFIPGVGARLENLNSYIEYRVPATISHGELSMLVTNIHTNTEGGKTKLMSMREGNGDITTNDRRFTVEKRGNGFIAWRVITSSDQIDTVGAERVHRTFNPGALYLWTATYGGGRFNLSIREGGASGKQIYSFGKGYSGSYDPNPHRAFVGGPQGRGGIRTGSTPGITVRHVWLSADPRPSYANK